MEVNFISLRRRKVYLPVHFFLIIVITFELVVGINISPAPVASVNQGGRLTLTCELTEPGNVGYLYWNKGSQSVVINVQEGCNKSAFTNLDDSRISLECPPGWKTFIMHLDSINSADHQTKWRCSAVIDGSSRPGSNATTIFVRVPVLSLVISPSTTGSQTVDVTVGQKSAFTCHTGPGGSRPKANILWYRQQSGIWVPITSEVTESTSNVPGTEGMVITSSDLQYSPDKRDVKIKCTAGNDANGAPLEKQSAVNVQYSPEADPVISGDNTDTPLLEKSQVSLRCTVTGGNTKPVLAWTCDGINPSTTNGNSGEDVYSDIQFNVQRQQNTRRCTCSGSQTGTGWARSTSRTFVVYFGPDSVVFNYPSGTTAVELEDVPYQVICRSTEANPQVTSIRWFNGSTEITSGLGSVATGNIQANGGKEGSRTWSPTLTRYDDGASITCQATNGQQGIGPASKTMKLNVDYPPWVSVSSTPSPLIEGRLATLTCSAWSKPAATFAWPNAPPGSNQDATSGHLNIPDIRRTDSKTYRCTAVNQMAGGRQGSEEAEITLDVKYPPDVYVAYNNVTEDAKETTLTCQPDGNPQTYNYEPWKQKWMNGDEIRVFIDVQDARLTLPRDNGQLSYMDSGIYTVTVSNGIPDRNGQQLQSLDVVFIVKSRPVVLDGVTSQQGTALGVTVNMKVSFYCNDETPNVTWYKNKSIVTGTSIALDMRETKVQLHVFDKTIEENGYLATLVITNVQTSHLGMYRAVISNSIDSITVIREILPEGKPEKPSDLKTTGSESTSIMLSWIPGFHGGEDQTFVIQHKTDSSSWSGNITVPGYKLQNVIFNATVTGLTPDTHYTFRIYAVNKYGRSEYADSMPDETTSCLCSTCNHKEASPLVAAIVGSFFGGSVFTVIVIISTVLMRRILCPSDCICLQKKNDTYQDFKPPQSRSADEACPYDQLELYPNDTRRVQEDKPAYSLRTYVTSVPEPQKETSPIGSTSPNNEAMKYNEEVNPYINTTINQG